MLCLCLPGLEKKGWAGGWDSILHLFQCYTQTHCRGHITLPAGNRPHDYVCIVDVVMVVVVVVVVVVPVVD